MGSLKSTHPHGPYLIHHSCLVSVYFWFYPVLPGSCKELMLSHVPWLKKIPVSLGTLEGTSIVLCNTTLTLLLPEYRTKRSLSGSNTNNKIVNNY